MERASASPQQPDRTRGAGLRVSTVIGAGTLVSALVGLLVGWLIGDVARGLGNVFLWGMIATVVVGYLVAARNDRSQRPR